MCRSFAQGSSRSNDDPGADPRLLWLATHGEARRHRDWRRHGPGRLATCSGWGMHDPDKRETTLVRLGEANGVSAAVLHDLLARRRAGAHDSELVDLLGQADRGGLDPARARALLDELRTI